jgi:hypothetical protein
MSKAKAMRMPQFDSRAPLTHFSYRPGWGRGDDMIASSGKNILEIHERSRR